MLMNIINTLAKYPVGADWAWHVRNYKLSPIPGTDYKVPAGTAIPAPAAGRAVASRMDSGRWAVSIEFPNGDAITIRELGTLIGSYPRQVKQLAKIGKASAAKWPHIEYDNANGSYSQFEKHVSTTSTASTGTVKPIIEEEEMKPILVSIKNSKGAWAAGLIVMPSGHVWPFTNVNDWAVVGKRIGVSADFVSLDDFNAARAMGGLPAIPAA